MIIGADFRQIFLFSLPHHFAAADESAFVIDIFCAVTPPPVLRHTLTLKRRAIITQLPSQSRLIIRCCCRNISPRRRCFIVAAALLSRPYRELRYRSLLRFRH